MALQNHSKLHGTPFGSRYSYTVSGPYSKPCCKQGTPKTSKRHPYSDLPELSFHRTWHLPKRLQRRLRMCGLWLTVEGLRMSTYSWVSQLCLCRHRIGVVSELYPRRRWDQSSTLFVCGLHSTHSRVMFGVLGKGVRRT